MKHIEDKRMGNNITMKQCGNLRVALVHDFLVQRGGAERVLKVLSDMYPEAPIYTLLYDKEKMRGMFKGKDIRPSYLQKFPKFLRKHYQWLLPFFMVVPETFDLRDFDLAITSSGAWTKGIVTKLSTAHIAYLHSPMRFAWDYNERYVKETKHRRMNFLARIFFNYIRVWDRLAADRPDYLIANSKYTQRRIEKYYRRNATVIYPPVEGCHSGLPPRVDESPRVEAGDPESQEMLKRVQHDNVSNGYFLVVSRLSPYKKVDIAVEAFNKLGLPLVVIGEGQQKKHLKKSAKDNIKILGWQSDETIARYYANARAFVFPAEDDFGMTAVEAMAHGVPVIAFGKGGALEIVQEGITGELFAAQTPEVLADGVRRFMLKEKTYDKEVIKKSADQFSRERFEKEMREYVNRVMSN